MTLTNSQYKLRDVIVFSLDEPITINKILDLDNAEIPKLFCKYITNNRIFKMDFGSWCYARRKFDRTDQNQLDGFLIDSTSFKPDRILGVKFILENMFNRNNSITAIKSTFKKFNTIINYINKNFTDYNCSNTKEAEIIYIEYTKYQMKIIESKKNNSGLITTESYKSNQDILAKFLSACTQTNINNFHSLIRRIESIRIVRPIHKIEIADSINNKAKILLETFNTISDHIINDKPLPCIIDLTPYNLNIIYIDVGLINKSNELFLSFLYNNKELISLENFNKKINEYYKDYPSPQGSIEKGRIRALYYKKISNLNNLNLLDFKECETKILMANFCMVAFAKLLISTSGANESVIYDLKINSFQTISNEKGKRAIGIKNRAGGKEVTIEFGIRFKQVFEKFIKFREKINFLYGNKMPHEYKSLLFIKLPVKSAQSYNAFMKLDSISFDKFNNTYRTLFKDSAPTNKEFRKNVANSFFNFTNSSVITSIKLSNTPEMASKKYTNLSFSELANQLTDYFTKLNDIIIQKGRVHTNLIPIKTESNITISTIMGNCSTEQPKLIDGFNNEAPLPLCNNPKSCLYCSSFVLHLNKIDIRKILSLKYILEFNSKIKEEQQRIIFRINEIIQFILEKDPKIKELINEINEEVNEGYLDDYWNNHLTMLVDMQG